MAGEELQQQTQDNAPAQINQPPYPGTTKIENGTAFDVSGKPLGQVDENGKAVASSKTAPVDLSDGLEAKAPAHPQEPAPIDLSDGLVPKTHDDHVGALHKLWNWANEGLISKDTILDVMQQATATGKYQDVTTQHIHPTAHIPGFGDIDLDTLQKGVMDSTAGVASSFTSPLSIALFGGSKAVQTGARSVAVLRAVRATQAAADAVDAADSVYQAAVTDATAASRQWQEADRAAKAADDAFKAGKGTREAADSARTVASQQAANLKKAQEAAKTALESRANAAYEASKSASEAQRLRAGVGGKVATAVSKAAPESTLTKTIKGITTVQRGAGVGIAATQIPQVLEGQQEGETAADALERRLNAAGWSLLVAGHEAGSLKSDALNRPISELPESLRADVQRYKDWRDERAENKQMAKRDQRTIGRRETFMKVFPPTNAAPYEPEEAETAWNHIEHYHTAEEPVQTTKDVGDALEFQRKGIENEVTNAVRKYGQQPFDRAESLEAKVREKLAAAEKITTGTLKKGMAALEPYHIDDLTLEGADNLRRQLNHEVRDTLSDHDWDLGQSLATDPEFAAKYHLLDELREGIYDQLKDNRVENADEMRREEKALINVRNAVNRQTFKGDVKIRGTSEAGAGRKIAAQVAQHGIAAAATGLGAYVAGVPGAIAGGAVGETVGHAAGKAIMPPDLTRNDLVQRMTRTSTAKGEPLRLIDRGTPPPPAAPGETAKPVEPETFKPEDRQHSDLHAELATHFNQRMSDTTYNELEQRFLEDVESKQRHSIALTAADKKILGLLNKADKVDIDAAKKFAEDQKEKLSTKQTNVAVAEAPETKGDFPFETTDREIPEYEGQAKIKSNTPFNTRLHEIAHLIVSHLINLPGIDVISHMHPDIDGDSLAEARADVSRLYDEEGHIDPAKARANLGDLVTRWVAGGVAEELYGGVPFDQNMTAKSDMAGVKALFKELGITPEDQDRIFDQAKAQAHEMLTGPGVEDLIRRYATKRRAGVSDRYHLNGPTTAQMLEELGNLGKEGPNGKGSKEGKAGDQKDATAAGKRPREVGKETDTGGKGAGKGKLATKQVAATETETGPQGGHAGGGVASVEELNRPGRFVKFSRSGAPTDQGKTPDFNLRPGEAGYQVTAEGPRLVAGEESSATKRGAEAYHKEVFGKKLATNQTAVVEEEETPELRVPYKEGRTVPPERTAGKHDEAIKAGGGIPGGIQEGDPEINLPDLALFHDPTTGSTLALKADQVTPENVKKQIQKSRQTYLQARPEESRIPTKGQPGYDEEIHGAPKPAGKTGLLGKLKKTLVSHDEVLDNIKRAYGVHDDPKLESGAGFITPDARHIDLPSGVDHTDAIWQNGGPEPSKGNGGDNRRDFINESGTIRVHRTRERSGPVLAFSVPKNGVTPEQADAMARSFGANGDRNGVLRIERADVNAENKAQATTEKDFPRMSDVKPMLEKIGGLKTNQSVVTDEEKPAVSEGANAFNAERGRGEINAESIPHSPEVAKRIADEYDKLQHNPNDPAVKKAYGAAVKDINDQWDYAQDKMGIKFEPWTKEGQPYANSKEMKADVDNNKHLYFFQGGELPADHPLAQVDPKTGFTYNDKLRAIHDLFGHAAHGFQFGPKGEENAWNTHRQMFSPEAIPAITTETRGQNSWVNFGQHLRNEVGEVPAKGEAGYISPTERPYAANKAAILPEEFHQPNSDVDLKTRQNATPEWKKRVEETPWETHDKGSFASGFRTLSVPDKFGKEAGHLWYEENHETGVARIRHSTLTGSYQNQGIAKEMYKSAIEDARKRGMSEFRSDDQVSSQAQNVWNSLIREGKYNITREYTNNPLNANGEGGVEYTVHLNQPNEKLTDVAAGAGPQAWADQVTQKPFGGINPNNPEAPSKKYGFEIAPEHRHNPSALTAEEAKAYAERPEVKAALAAHPDVKLGWDTTTNGPELNIGASTDDLETAKKIAGKLDQRAIVDTRTGEEIPAGGEGKRTAFPEYPLEQRLNDLRTPQAKVSKIVSGARDLFPESDHTDERSYIEPDGTFRSVMDQDHFGVSELYPNEDLHDEDAINKFMNDTGWLRTGKYENSFLIHGGDKAPTSDQLAQAIKQLKYWSPEVSGKIMIETPNGSKQLPDFAKPGEVRRTVESMYKKGGDLRTPQRKVTGIHAEVLDKIKKLERRKVDTEPAVNGHDALWENWDKAVPFTAHKDGFLNIGDTHEAAFAQHHFNGKIPEDFDGWEDLGGDDDHARGWAAKDGSKMFLWDDLRDMMMENENDPDATWPAFKNALAELQKRGMAKSGTHLWDNGGEGGGTYLGTLGELALLPDKKLSTAQTKVKGSSVPLMKNPLDVEGTGEKGRVGTLDIARALNEYSRSKNPALEPGEAEPEEMVKRAQKIAEDEAKYQLAQGKTGKEWYTEEMKDHDKVLQEMRPELAGGQMTDAVPDHPVKLSLFKAAEAILSSGQKPYANFKSAVKAWDLYNETGEFPRINPETGKSWGPRGVNAYGSAFDSLNKLIAEKGEKGAADWLLNEHPVKELRGYMSEGQSPVAGKATDMVPGAMVLGAKRGPFMQNLHGMESKFTADMWVARTWNRWMGTLDLDPRIEDKGKVTSESDAPRNDSERKLMKESFEKTATKLGLSTSSLQAILWYYEQALYRAHGVPVESWSFADAAKRVRDEYSPQQAEMFPYGEAQQKGGLDALQAPPGATPEGGMHAFDFLRALKTLKTAQSKVTYSTPKGWNQYGPTTAPGLVKQGNIDLTTRPVVKNDDGTFSSEYSTSFDDGKGHEVLVPTVVDGKFLTPDGKKPKEGSSEEKAMFQRAWQHYEQTGQHLGMFDNAKHADLAASRIHNRPKK